MRRLDLELLGGFRARLEGGGRLHVPTRKAQALLAYLALPRGQSHPRDKLAALLWGDMSQKQARANLRQVLAALRRLLGDPGPLRLDGDTVTLDPSRASVDVWRLETCAKEQTPQAFADVEALYGGDFLAGLTLQEPPFEEWLVAQRERLREQAMEALARLLAHRRQAGDLEAGVQSAIKLLALDPLQEPVHRTLMRLYANLGRRGAALRQYQVCATALERELRAQPEPETRALYQRILTERPSAPSIMAEPCSTETALPPSATSTPATAEPRRVTGADIPPTEIPLVGRAAELAWLTERLDAAGRGQGQLVAILGDPGVGKSRLAAEVIAQAAQRGARILVGRCFETEQRLPFGMWVEALRSGGAVDDASVIDTLTPAWRSELAQLLPELGPSPAPARVGAHPNPLRLFEAIALLIEHLARRQPLAILCEDAHWIDEMSLRVLGFLARRLPRWPVLVLTTVRAEETIGNTLHRQVDEELLRHGLLAQLSLSPLSREDVVALAHRILPPGTAAPLAEAVWRTSEGNAFVAVETARTLTDTHTRTPASGLPLPARVRDLVSGRLERLSERARRLVTASAVIGRQFDFELLHRAAELSEMDAADATEELVRRRIIRQSGEGFEFTHDLIREVAYSALLPPQRTILHRQVAEGLEAVRGADDPDTIGELAFHAREGAAWAKAVRHFSRFGDEVARRYANVDAAQAFRQALAALDRLPAGRERDRQRLALTMRLAQAVYLSGDIDVAVGTLINETQLLHRVGDPSLSGPWHAWLGHVYTRLGDQSAAVTSARRAIDAAERAGDGASGGKAYGILSNDAFFGGRAREGVALGQRAAQLLEPTDDYWWLGIAYFYTAMNWILLGRFAQAREPIARVRELAEAAADHQLQSYAAWATGWIEAQEGRHADALASCRRSLELAPDPLSHAYASAFLGCACVEAGHAAEAVPHLVHAVEASARFRFRPYEATFLVYLAEARLLEGALDTADDLATRGEALATEVRFTFTVARAQRARARVARARDALDDAERLLTDALERYRAIEATFEAARTLVDLAQLASARGDLRRAGAHARSAQEEFQALDLPLHAARAEAAGHPPP